MARKLILLLSVLLLFCGCKNKNPDKNIYDEYDYDPVSNDEGSLPVSDEDEPESNDDNDDNKDDDGDSPEIDNGDENDDEYTDDAGNDIDHEDDDEDSEMENFPDDNDEDNDEDVDDGEPRIFETVIISPVSGAVIEAGNPSTFKGTVTDNKYPLSEIIMKWYLKKDDVITLLKEENADVSGVSEFQHTFTKEEAGKYSVFLTAVAPDDVEFSSGSNNFGVCRQPFGDVQTFDSESMEDGWVYAKDAYWDSDGTNGWLELTGNVTNKMGVIYNSDSPVYPGDITMKIKIRTGMGTGTGADGFAMTVYDAKNSIPIEDYVDAVRSGGCLGYGVAGTYCGSGGELEIAAFHVEFDTWYNDESGIDDPTENNHVAITLSGNPGDHKLWEETELEDFEWHEIEIKTAESNITVKMDDVTIIDGIIPDFFFRGGYIMFSGSTGASTNFHSIDDLEVIQQCTVPDDD